MHKNLALVLVPLLLVGLLVTSFTVCQGLMTEGSELGFKGNCEADVFCQQMCQLTSSDFPALTEKVSSQIKKATILALVFTLGIHVGEQVLPRFGIHSVPLKFFSAEVYLLNAAFLI